MKKSSYALHLVLISLYFLAGSNLYAQRRTEIKLLQIGLCQNLGYLGTMDNQIKSSHKDINAWSAFPSINLEVLRLSKKSWTINWFSIDTGINYGFKDNDLIKSNLYHIRLNMGITHEFEQKLKWKSGKRSYTFLLTFGMLANAMDDFKYEIKKPYPRFVGGFQWVIRFLPAESQSSYEPDYYRWFALVEKVDNQAVLVRVGLGVYFDWMAYL